MFTSQIKFHNYKFNLFLILSYGCYDQIAIWKEFNILNCYTLEISFCGADLGKYEYFHFNQDIYKEIA